MRATSAVRAEASARAFRAPGSDAPRASRLKSELTTWRLLETRCCTSRIRISRLSAKAALRSTSRANRRLAHADDEEDVDGHDEGVETQGDPGRDGKVEAGRADPEPPCGQARKGGGEDRWTQAGVIGHQHNGRKEGQVWKARRKPVGQSEAQCEGQTPGDESQQVTAPRCASEELSTHGFPGRLHGDCWFDLSEMKARKSTLRHVR